MYILGISALYHDSAAALLRDGDLVAAAQEERFSRIKYDERFPVQAIECCLHEAGITAKDLDYVVFYEKPLEKFERILQSSLGTFPRSWKVFREAMIAWLREKLWLKSVILDKLPVPAERILFVEHHLSHAASALFCSPFEEAAVLTIDGVGEWTTTALGTGCLGRSASPKPPFSPGRRETTLPGGSVTPIATNTTLTWPRALNC
jgi:carbamoyltransferase